MLLVLAIHVDVGALAYISHACTAEDAAVDVAAPQCHGGVAGQVGRIAAAVDVAIGGTQRAARQSTELTVGDGHLAVAAHGTFVASAVDVAANLHLGTDRRTLDIEQWTLNIEY